MQETINLFEQFSSQKQGIPLKQSLRVSFVKKVYGILSFQIMFTMLMCAASMKNKAFAQFQMANLELMGVAFAGQLLTTLAISFSSTVRRQIPYNYICLGLFTFCEAYSLSLVCGLTDPTVVLIAGFLTLSVTFALTVYAMTTKNDLTIFGGFMISFLTGSLVLSILNIWWRNPLIENLLLISGVVIYGTYIVYDTQIIMGGKRGEISIDDYIFGAMTLYIDIVVLFIKILRIIEKLNGSKKKKNNN